MKKWIVSFLLLLSFSSQAQNNEVLLLAEKPSHFYGRIQTGILVGNVNALSINAATGYHFRFGLETGISIGRENYTYNYSPLLAEVNYAFHEWKSIKPFVGVNGGLMINLSPYHYYSKSPMGCFGVRVGFTRLITKHLGWTTSIGYRYMQLYEPVFYPFGLEPNIPGLININKHVAELRIGLELR